MLTEEELLVLAITEAGVRKISVNTSLLGAHSEGKQQQL